MMDNRRKPQAHTCHAVENKTMSATEGRFQLYATYKFTSNDGTVQFPSSTAHTTAHDNADSHRITNEQSSHTGLQPSRQNYVFCILPFIPQLFSAVSIRQITFRNPYSAKYQYPSNEVHFSTCLWDVYNSRLLSPSVQCMMKCNCYVELCSGWKTSMTS